MSRWEVTGTRGRYVVTQPTTGQTSGPIYLRHDDAACAAARLNHPAGKHRPTPQQGDLFTTAQEA